MGQLILEPKHRPEVDVIGNLAEGVRTIVHGLKSIFATKEKVEVVKPKLATQETVLLYGKNVQSVELVTVSKQLSSYYYQSRVYSVDVKSIYESIKDDLVLTVMPFVSALSGTSYEEILRNAMDMARMANNPITRGIDALPMLDNLLKTDLIEADSFNVNRTTLAIVWSSLILALFSKWTSVCDGEKKRIVKSGIALSLGIGVSFVQFCHKSPESITNYIRMLYEGYNDIRDKYNQRHEKHIPDILKINSPRADFALMTSHEKISVGQVLNMVYTFRIGDIVLSVLESMRDQYLYISDDICERIFTSINPTPNDEEVNKLYRLYTEGHIYNLS